MHNYLKRHREDILSKRVSISGLDKTTIEAIDDMLLHPDINGQTRVSLSGFDSYRAGCDLLAGVRAYYEARGWTIVDYGFIYDTKNTELEVPSAVTENSEIYMVLE